MMDDNAIAVQRKLNNPYIFKTFRNRTITEQLLSPERMNGNLTEHDYQAAVKFLPNNRNNYADIGLYSLAAIAPLYRLVSTSKRVVIRPPLPVFSSTAIGLATTAGMMLGLVGGFGLTIRSTSSFWNSLESPEGFDRALSNVMIKAHGTNGATGVPSPTSDQGNEAWSFPDESPQTVTAQGASTTPNPAAQTSPTQKSRWEQIRTANASSSTSSWDAIRQKHERQRIPNSAPTSRPGMPEINDDRAIEQAKFDALVDKERNMK